ncbi:alpha/beta hydrolase [Fodinibius sediminis]|uniref:Alpha/beta hydrolase n=1 Tax=Fodinibius sediminis TaxID=1214077 RepID=A0A521CLY4_9BACT|nr:alpha/beta hydrolase [Fodinibius sediminis]SMO59771.1 hypothetical protein SAMN06265218_106145 [Fodinibius sediminis]
MNLMTDIPDDPSCLDDFLEERESSYNLMPDTRARISWNNKEKTRKTEYALVYLHGFRASQQEGHPVHRAVADFLGANLFLSRLQEHGIESDRPLQYLTEEKLLASAHFALAIGKKIGRKVLIMGTSTGGSLGLYLAAHPSYRSNISGLILYSPLIRFYGIKEKLLECSLGRRALHIIPGKSHQIKTQQTTYAEDRIWYPSYILKGALALGAFVDHYMNPSLFRQIQCPVFVGYYYKNKQEQDKVVSIKAIRNLIRHLNQNGRQVYDRNFPNAKNHVICSSLVSRSVDQVIRETQTFLKSVGLHQNNHDT